jgi:hypothetical protein
MKELIEYRQKMLERVLGATAEFCAACRAVEDPFAAVDEGGWNTHQLAAHTRDVDKLVYGLRTRRTVTEDNPEFQRFDPENWVKTLYDVSEPLASILDEFSANMEGLVSLLRELPAEAWARESRHPTLGGGLTTQTWVERGLSHIEEHLASVKKTVA